MHGDEDQLGARKYFLQLPGGVDPIELRHRDVERHDVRLEFFGHSKQGPAILRDAHNLAPILQQLPESIQYQGMVIRQEHTGPAHSSSSSTGTTTCTVVPLPMSEIICKA